VGRRRRLPCGLNSGGWAGPRVALGYLAAWMLLALAGLTATARIAHRPLGGDRRGRPSGLLRNRSRSTSAKSEYGVLVEPPTNSVPLLG
jgi:hypothetical protein